MNEKLGTVPGFVRDRPLTEEALAFGAEAHARQVREADAAPFILHPLEVAWLLTLLPPEGVRGVLS